MTHSFVMTPTNIDLLESVFRNPYTGRWVVPVLTFNTTILNPFIGEIDPLNEDPKYHSKVIDHFYIRLTEKWLYKDPEFRSLLKYFKIEKDGKEGKVSLITDIDKVNKEPVDKTDRKYIFKYIEKFFITRKIVSRILKKYVAVTHVKWYDLFNNTDVLKELFAHKLKKLIISTIYELQEMKPKKGK